MNIFIIVCITLAFWHFIYEGIIAPQLRLKLRHDLFVVRDGLRNLQLIVSKEDHDTRRAIKVVSTAVESWLERMSTFTLYMGFKLKQEIDRNKELKQAVEKEFGFIKKSNNETLKSIDKKFNQICAGALLVNSGGLLPYLVMVMFPLLIMAVAYENIKKLLNTVSKEVALTPDKYYPSPSLQYSVN